MVRRDPKADGKFFYSVRTTGIYCRPSCASRLPLRANVAFHDTCSEAEGAGHRPCKRCQPNDMPLEDQHAATMARACRLIKSAERAPALQSLAKSVGMSAFHFHRVFKRVVGLTPKAYAVAHRAEQMRQVLPGHRSVTAAFHGAGYQSSSRFYEKSSEVLGMRPSDFRKGGAGATIQFAVGECSLGSVLAASSVKGVCAILLGDDPAALVKDLHERFPKATLVAGNRAYTRVVARVIRLVERPQAGLALPLDVRGTAFQQRVWKALREIPAGRTETYTEVAARVGKPGAVRAVAGACAANAIAVAIPCHRVIRNDGSLAGYRWGVARKRTLLERERQTRGA